jgi:aminopeptidase-like protein|tara:strand:+ start:1477 stop:2034 length:558 start_codon:yes stop_codon:yes gene_type:complete
MVCYGKQDGNYIIFPSELPALTHTEAVSRNVFHHNISSEFREGGFRELACNDDLVFADPDFNVPMISLQRFPYPEYHTSLDNMSIIFPDQLEESYHTILHILDVLETDYIPQKKFVGPLYMSRYGLYVENRKFKEMNKKLWHVMQNIGVGKSVLEISNELKMNYFDLYTYLSKWVSHDLLGKTDV